MKQHEAEQIARQALRGADLKSFLAHVDFKEAYNGFYSTADGIKMKPEEDHIFQEVVRLIHQVHGITKVLDNTVTRFHRLGTAMIIVTRIDGHKTHYIVSLSINFSIVEFPYNPDCG